MEVQSLCEVDMVRPMDCFALLLQIARDEQDAVFHSVDVGGNVSCESKLVKMHKRARLELPSVYISTPRIW